MRYGGRMPWGWVWGLGKGGGGGPRGRGPRSQRLALPAVIRTHHGAIQEVGRRVVKLADTIAVDEVVCSRKREPLVRGWGGHRQDDTSVADKDGSTVLPVEHRVALQVTSLCVKRDSEEPGSFVKREPDLLSVYEATCTGGNTSRSLKLMLPYRGNRDVEHLIAHRKVGDVMINKLHRQRVDWHSA